MKFLVVGAGAIGGYFGGRLIQKGEDVTFLVRPGRQKQLQEQGLTLKSTHGDFHTSVRTITYTQQTEEFDVIILSVKAYHLEQVIQDITPFVQDKTVVLPLLNGYKHYTQLQEAFGRENILGGLCFIETTLDQEGHIIQTSPRHDLVFGEWDGTMSDRVQTIHKHMTDAGFTLQLSDQIQKEVWHKYIFISSMSGITTLMRSPIGPIFATRQGKEIVRKLVSEIVTIARLVEAPVAQDVVERTFTTMGSLNYAMKSSMQRDMEKSLPAEADHLHGALLDMGMQHGQEAENFPILSSVYANLKVYEETLKN